MIELHRFDGNKISFIARNIFAIEPNEYSKKCNTNIYVVGDKKDKPSFSVLEKYEDVLRDMARFS